MTAKKIDFHWLRNASLKSIRTGIWLSISQRLGLIVTTKGPGVIFGETSEIKQYVILINAKIESTNVDFSGKGEKNIVDYLFT